MTRKVYCLSLESTYAEASRLLTLHPVRSYPLVDSRGLFVLVVDFYHVLHVRTFERASRNLSL